MNLCVESLYVVCCWYEARFALGRRQKILSYILSYISNWRMINSGDFEYWEGRWRDMKVRDFLIEKSEYTVAKNPNDGKWYVLGSTGRGKSGKTYYMPVSSGFKSKKDAEKWAKKQPLADREAKGLMPESVFLLEGGKEYEVARGDDKLWYVVKRVKGKKHYKSVAAGFKSRKQATVHMKKLMSESKRPNMTTVQIFGIVPGEEEKIKKAAKKFGGNIEEEDQPVSPSSPKITFGPFKVTFKSDIKAEEFYKYTGRFQSGFQLVYK